MASDVPRTLQVMEGAGTGIVLMLAIMPPPPPLHLPPTCPQVASCPEQAAQPASTLASDEEDHQLHLTRKCPHKQQHPHLQDLSNPQNPPALINVETKAHTHNEHSRLYTRHRLGAPSGGPPGLPLAVPILTSAPDIVRVHPRQLAPEP